MPGCVRGREGENREKERRTAQEEEIGRLTRVVLGSQPEALRPHLFLQQRQRHTEPPSPSSRRSPKTPLRLHETSCTSPFTRSPSPTQAGQRASLFQLRLEHPLICKSFLPSRSSFSPTRYRRPQIASPFPSVEGVGGSLRNAAQHQHLDTNPPLLPRPGSLFHHRGVPSDRGTDRRQSLTLVSSQTPADCRLPRPRRDFHIATYEPPSLKSLVTPSWTTRLHHSKRTARMTASPQQASRRRCSTSSSRLSSSASPPPP